jgi:transposase-like protein
MARKRLEEVNLMQLMERYGSDDKCREVLEELRWPDGVRCPRCESDKISRIRERGQFDCDSCRYQFSVTAGTIFHDSHLPLRKWFVAIYLICESKKGISSNQLKRILGVTYKTAWYLTHRIRAAMGDGDAPLLRGIVEVDETYIGGKARGRGRGYMGNKAMVVGAAQRGGDIRLRVGPNNSAKVLHGFIRETVDGDAEAIYTDQHQSYMGIDDSNTRHETVNHNLDEWVRADVHTNTVEGVWSLLKRSIVGSYHHLSVRHLPAYLDEISFRFNNRNNPYLFRDTLLKLIGAETMPYSELVAEQ